MPRMATGDLQRGRAARCVWGRREKGGRRWPCWVVDAGGRVTMAARPPAAARSSNSGTAATRGRMTRGRGEGNGGGEVRGGGGGCRRWGSRRPRGGEGRGAAGRGCAAARGGGQALRGGGAADAVVAGCRGVLGGAVAGGAGRRGRRGDNQRWGGRGEGGAVCRPSGGRRDGRRAGGGSREEGGEGEGVVARLAAKGGAEPHQTRVGRGGWDHPAASGRHP